MLGKLIMTVWLFRHVQWHNRALENMEIDAGYRVKETEMPDILHTWNLALQFIEALGPTKIIVGHIKKGWDFDAKG
jgi:hypothetical protein